MSLQVGERQTISVCKKTRRSLWAGPKTNRHTDEGMKMTVVIEKDQFGRKVSRTEFVK